MNQDDINRDRLLTEVHSDVRHMVEWAEKHDKLDDIRFTRIEKDQAWQNKILYGCVGVVVFIELFAKLFR